PAGAGRAGDRALRPSPRPLPAQDAGSVETVKGGVMGYRYGPVVVGVDGSADSVGALRWAADAACRHSRELHAVHVLRPDAPPGEASRALANEAAVEARRWLPGVCATGVAYPGDTVEVLRRH